VTVNDGTYILVKGLCWATHENPTTNDDFYQEAESGVGSFAISMTALNIGTTYYARAYAVTPNGTVYGDQKTFTTRNGIPTLTTAEVTDITGENAISGGDITEDGGLSIIARGVCWSTSPNPTIADSHTSNGGGTGSFSSSITGLNVSTTYYVRAYASTAAGTGYGDEMSFTTRSGIPTLMTAEVTDITVYSATCGGTVTDDGGLTVITRGVCWSTVSNPTIDDSYTDDGNGTGSFSSGLTDLNLSTTYYVRAYATTSAGTGYGEQKIFVTRNGIPTLTTAEVTGIMANSATCGGTVTDDGGLEVITKGVCWSMNPNPSMSDSHSSDGTGLGDFVSNLTSLTPNTTYYVRAYATNSYVTVYGNQRSFTTELPSYTVSVSSNPTDGGTATGGSAYVQGQSCTVQAVANIGYTFSNWTENDSVVSTDVNYTFIVNADRNLVANFSDNVPSGAINGLFTINSNGDQVFFSQGNLQYRASTHTWRFATNQWDFVGTQTPDYYGYVGGTVNGSDNQYISNSYSGWIDLFGWGTSGYSHGAVCYHPYDTYSTNAAYYAYGDIIWDLDDKTGKADWGYNPITNGGNQENQWRTLGETEWIYVFNTRTTTSGIRYVKAKVNNVNGIILLPDDWTTSIYTLNNANGGNYSNNTITAYDWTNILEANGAVFLPAAGYRGASVNYVNYIGYYWSASTGNSERATSMRFNNSVLNASILEERCHGLSVRLVHNAE
jgi:hypothetical protein